MSEQEDCKGCIGSVYLTEQEIKQIFGSTIKVKNVKLASEEVYATRLSQCEACDALQYGTTCKYCGCVVQVKAKIRSATCPYPFLPRWQLDPIVNKGSD